MQPTISHTREPTTIHMHLIQRTYNGSHARESLYTEAGSAQATYFTQAFELYNECANRNAFNYENAENVEIVVPTANAEIVVPMQQKHLSTSVSDTWHKQHQHQQDLVGTRFSKKIAARSAHVPKGYETNLYIACPPVLLHSVVHCSRPILQKKLPIQVW